MLPPALRQAMGTMVTGRPSSVNLDIPCNLFKEAADVEFPPHSHLDTGDGRVQATPISSSTCLSAAVRPKTTLIHIDIDPQELWRNYPPDLGVIAGAKVFVRQLLTRQPQWRDIDGLEIGTAFYKGDTGQSYNADFAAWARARRRWRHRDATG